MGLVLFTVQITGIGGWSLDIQDKISGQSLAFSNTASAPQSLSMPIGPHQLIIQGSAPASGGSSDLNLVITGPIGGPSSITNNYPPGTIPAHFINLFVTT